MRANIGISAGASGRYDYMLHATVPWNENWGIRTPQSELGPIGIEELGELCESYERLSLTEPHARATYKALNHQLALREFILGTAICRSRPFVIQASRSEVCNLNCIFCRPSTHCQPHELPLPEWRQALHTVLPPAVELLAYCWGEPLMDSAFAETCEIASGHGVQISLITNLQHMTDATAQAVAQHVTRLLISVDSVDEDEFARLRRGADLATVQTNLELVRRAAAKLGRPMPWFGISVVLLARTLEGLPDLLEWAWRHGASGLSVRRVVLREGIARCLAAETIELGSEPYLHTHQVCQDLAAQRQMVISLPLHQHVLSIPQRCPCPWTHAYISPEGRLHPCSFSHRRSLGVLPVMPDYWNSEAIRRMRLAPPDGFDCPECSSLDRVGLTGVSQFRGY